MDVRIVGVPVIDRDPVEARLEILCHVGHEVAGEAPEVADLPGIFRTDDETEMMTIILAARCEVGAVSAVALRVEHRGVAPVASDAIAFEILDMESERSPAEGRARETSAPRLEKDARRLRGETEQR